MVSMPAESVQEQLRQWGVISPVDPELASRWSGAPRLLGLQGKVGGFLGNRKANANQLLLDVREVLDKQFELQDSMVLDKFIYSRPADDEVVDALMERCDFVVTAIAD